MVAVLIVLSILLIVLIMFLIFGVFIVKQETVAIVERLGKYNKYVGAGIHIMVPFVDRVASRISLKVHQLNVEVETKTKDNVFINIVVSVQFRVLHAKVYEAFYKLIDPIAQVKSFIFDVVRAQVPLQILDDVFTTKDDIAFAVKNELSSVMGSFGYEIVQTLVTDIHPDKNVKAAMNEINTAQRLRVAAAEKAEAEKILRVKAAEAESEAAILHGKGIAGQRQAILDGFSHTIESIKNHSGITDTNKVLDMVLLIQYLDTMKEIGASAKSNVVFMPHSPSGAQDVAAQIREGILSGEYAKNMMYSATDENTQ